MYVVLYACSEDRIGIHAHSEPAEHMVAQTMLAVSPLQPPIILMASVTDLDMHASG